VAIPWAVLATKIPWRSLLVASPEIVHGAKKLYQSFKAKPDARAEPSLSPAPAGSDAENIANLEQRLLALEGKLDELGVQQESAADLINALAEQNAAVVKAIDVLRVRTRFLIYVCGALVIVLIAIGAWLALA